MYCYPLAPILPNQIEALMELCFRHGTPSPAIPVQAVSCNSYMYIPVTVMPCSCIYSIHSYIQSEGSSINMSGITVF